MKMGGWGMTTTVTAWGLLALVHGAGELLGRPQLHYIFETLQLFLSGFVYPFQGILY